MAVQNCPHGPFPRPNPPGIVGVPLLPTPFIWPISPAHCTLLFLNRRWQSLHHIMASRMLQVTVKGSLLVRYNLVKQYLLKIWDKFIIKNKTNFVVRLRVYITVPLFPEGDPTSMASQEILYWQNLTMEAMYRRIALEIQVAVSVHEVQLRKLRRRTPKNEDRSRDPGISTCIRR